MPSMLPSMANRNLETFDIHNYRTDILRRVLRVLRPGKDRGLRRLLERRELPPVMGGTSLSPRWLESRSLFVSSGWNREQSEAEGSGLGLVELGGLLLCGSALGEQDRWASQH